MLLPEEKYRKQHYRKYSRFHSGVCTLSGDQPNHPEGALHDERGLRTPGKPTQILLSRVDEELKNKEGGERKGGHKRNL
jgi:hypothetical protein